MNGKKGRGILEALGRIEDGSHKLNRNESSLTTEKRPWQGSGSVGTFVFRHHREGRIQASLRGAYSGNTERGAYLGNTERGAYLGITERGGAFEKQPGPYTGANLNLRLATDFRLHGPTMKPPFQERQIREVHHPTKKR